VALRGYNQAQEVLLEADVRLAPEQFWIRTNRQGENLRIDLKCASISGFVGYRQLALHGHTPRKYVLSSVTKNQTERCGSNVVTPRQLPQYVSRGSLNFDRLSLGGRLYPVNSTDVQQDALLPGFNRARRLAPFQVRESLDGVWES